MTPLARLTDLHVCPLPGHGTTPIVAVSTDTFINGFGAARVGDVCGCGAVITTGFPNIQINGRPAAHLGSLTSHGGTLTSGSPDTFGGIQCEGAASHAIVNFAKLGAIRPDGSLDEPLLAELLADPRFRQRASLAGALVQQTPGIDEPKTPELIAVAGSQHDNGSGNKMMFIGQAVRELALFVRVRPDFPRTLVVFTPAYNQQMLKAARDSAITFGASVVEVTTAQELIDYLNTGRDRQQFPIEHLSLFSHGVPHRIAFGYQLAEDEAMSLDVLSYTRISPQSFSPTAEIDSYACQTGMGNSPDLFFEEGVQFFPQTNESLAQLMANHLQRKMRAFIRRSDYVNTWGTFEDRQLGKLCELSDNATPNKEWCRNWSALLQERYDSDSLNEFTYQNNGASHPVVSGDTPFGAPGGYFEFIPK